MSETDRVGEVLSPRRPRQFGLRSLLLLTFVAAVGIVGWKKFIYIHPAHRNVMYEKAPYSRSGKATFGDCQIALKSVARNDRHGAVAVEDGFGNAVTSAAKNGIALRNSGPWLDAAQIELFASSGSFDVIEARVFDFESRQIIDKIDLRSGAWMSSPTTLQINRMGAKLPDQVDVFLRLSAYGAKDKPVTLQPQEGATCKFAGGVVEIKKLVRGMKGYQSQTGIVPDPTQAQSEVVVMLQFKGDWPTGKKMKLVAVRKDGSRAHSDRYLRFPGSYLVEKIPPGAPWDGDDSKRGELVQLQAGLDEISYFEVREYEGQHVFFFEGVQLPKTSAAKFIPPPTATVQIGGVETTVKIPEFQPLDVQITTMRGDAVQGTSGNRSGYSVTLREGGAKDVESKTTIVDRVRGAARVRSTLSVNPGKSPTKLGSSSHMCGIRGFIRHSVVALPVEEVQSVEVQLPDQ